MDEIDTEALLKEIEQPEQDRLMSDAEAEPAAVAEQKAPEAPSWNGEDWAFDWNGKRIVPDSREKLQTWVQLGYNNSSRAADINRREAEFKALEAKYKPYADVDEYAVKNKDWWQHVQEAYAKRGEQAPAATAALDPSLQAALKPFEEKLAQVNSFIESQQKEREIQEQTRFNEALTKEVEAIRTQHPTIDLNAVDESGQTLEYRVMQHATTIGTGSFRAAFRDYLHDQLVESAKANSQAAAVKAKEHEKRQGILGKSPTPKKPFDDAPANVRGKSYDQITQDIYREYGLT